MGAGEGAGYAGFERDRWGGTAVVQKVAEGTEERARGERDWQVIRRACVGGQQDGRGGQTGDHETAWRSVRTEDIQVGGSVAGRTTTSSDSQRADTETVTHVDQDIYDAMRDSQRTRHTPPDWASRAIASIARGRFGHLASRTVARRRGLGQAWGHSTEKGQPERDVGRVDDWALALCARSRRRGQA